MSKIIRWLVVASLLVAGIIVFPSSQSPASAAYCVGIHCIYYNSPGTDSGSNTSLNAEWIQLRNRCSTSRSLTNAKVKDAAGHTYTFGSYTLGGGKYVKVHTGKGTNTTSDRYQGRSWYVWNNDKDTAYLYTHPGPGSTAAPTITETPAPSTVSGPLFEPTLRKHRPWGGRITAPGLRMADVAGGSPTRAGSPVLRPLRSCPGKRPGPHAASSETFSLVAGRDRVQHGAP